MCTLLRLALLALRVSALNPHLRSRSDAPTAEDISNALAPVDDGPTSDNTAGIGAEFESSMFVFTSDCSPDNTFPSKGKIIDGRSGTNWDLTADTTLGAGKLTAEYILNGRQIKVGSDAAAAAGTAIVQDLTSWFASGLQCGTTVDVQDSACNPWTVNSISSIASLYWSVQITTPMPLEAVYSLFKQQFLNDIAAPRSILNGNARSARTALITKGHFTTNSNDITAAEVTDDVLAFCTLVMSYAKAALTGGAADSPKTYTTFMPRTEFNTMFKQVQAKIPGDLFGLFKSLACFTATHEVDSDGNPGWELDTLYCTGTVDDPQSNGVFETLQYQNLGQVLRIQDWITGIGAGSPSPDRLTTFDFEQFDGSIGGLNTAIEQIYESERQVPLFEFRNLDGIKFVDDDSGPANFMAKVDKEIQSLHETFATPL